ncbi:PREDICTED: uncharacterized protein LOC106807701 [Priapulus caudatus]|uniref:Uncharacterized protein LOC106807701 n=1 Tax=Priapulus caudatus TaxID=37621 RepID=A0ABM1E099_PRICU|nr:PREDICTED: uncharacterized protein LOC106807701 [Priapulus caudatus]
MEQETAPRKTLQKARHLSEIKGYRHKTESKLNATVDESSLEMPSSSTCTSVKRCLAVDGGTNTVSNSKRFRSTKTGRKESEVCTEQTDACINCGEDSNTTQQLLEGQVRTNHQVLTCQTSQQNVEEIHCNVQNTDLTIGTASPMTSLEICNNPSNKSERTDMDSLGRSNSVEIFPMEEAWTLRSEFADAGSATMALDEQACQALMDEAVLYESGDSDTSSSSSSDEVGDATAAATEEAVQDFARRVIHTITQTYVRLRRWQSRHMARSIIDNAINKVLEESGLAPSLAQSNVHAMPQLINDDYHDDDDDDDDEARNIEDNTRQQMAVSLEAEGVSAAILNRGLMFRRCCTAAAGELALDADSSLVAMPRPTSPLVASSMQEADAEETQLPKLAAIDQGHSNNADDLMDAAVSCAISHRGLGFL